MTGPIDPRIAAACSTPSAVLKHAHQQDAYFAQAHALGADPEVAQEVLREVVAELASIPTAGNAYDIAWHRLIELFNGVARPPEEWREAARQMLTSIGVAAHPEVVDGYAQQLQHALTADLTPRPRWYRRLRHRHRKALRNPFTR